MDEIVRTSEADQECVELGKWMGRRDAFGQIAGRCSAAEIESLRQIHDGKLYLRLNLTWEEFCSQQLHVSSRTIERELSYLRRFGPAFFTLRQLSRLSVREYDMIAEHITEEGLHVDGKVVALALENSGALTSAVKTLLEQNEPPMPPVSAPGFDAAFQRFRNASEGLCSFATGPDGEQSHALARELAKLLTTAAGWGVEIGIQ